MATFAEQPPVVQFHDIQLVASAQADPSVVAPAPVAELAALQPNSPAIALVVPDALLSVPVEVKAAGGEQNREGKIVDAEVKKDEHDEEAQREISILRTIERLHLSRPPGSNCKYVLVTFFVNRVEEIDSREGTALVELFITCFWKEPELIGTLYDDMDKEKQWKHGIEINNAKVSVSLCWLARRLCVCVVACAPLCRCHSRHLLYVGFAGG